MKSNYKQLKQRDYNILKQQQKIEQQKKKKKKAQN